MSDNFLGEGKATDGALELYSRWLILYESGYIRAAFMIYLVLGILGCILEWLLRKKATKEKKAAVVLTDEHKTCSVCFEAFTTDTNSTENENDRKHLPVVGLCQHFYCHGCILKRQSSLAQKNNGEVPEVISCMECRKRGSFCPSNPTYHRMLIGLLESSIPIVTEEDEK